MPATLKLYALSDDYLQALDALTAQVELPPEAIADTLEGLTGAWDIKALNVARYVRNLEAEAAAINEAKQRMDARAKAATRQAAWLKGYLQGELERTGLQPKAPDLALRLQANPPAVVVDDEAQIPADYWLTQTVTSLLKGDISVALKAGKTVPGARLVQSRRLVIT
jgi:hypothetical protein